MVYFSWFIVLIFILRTINRTKAFDTQAYSSAHPCIWSICEGLPSERDNYTITCCTLQVPLNYAKPNQSTISISMMCLSPSNTSNNFLFTLSGGPGESASLLLSIAATLIPAKYDITIIGPDHRGTGYSTPLTCEDKNSQNITADCINYLKRRWTIEGLNQFTTTAASHDLAIQIQAAQLIGRKSILGVSYGTYWLNRFLTIYPNLVQSAIMDSPVNPLLHAFTLYNIRASSMGIHYLTYCHHQVECIKHFPNSSPIVMLYKILQEIDENKQKCINKHLTKYDLTSNSIKQTFFMLFQSPTTDGTVLPALIFRLNRCNEEDVVALNFFFKHQSPSSSISSRQILSRNADTNTMTLFSYVLYSNIAYSELWLHLNQSDIDQSTLNTLQKSTLISLDLPSDIIQFRQNWPKYPVDEYRYRLANSSVLMLNGEFDPATPLDLAIHLTSITSKTRRLYSIPLSGHVVFVYAMISGYTCPIQLSLSWAFPTLFPSEWSDPSCLQDLPTTIDFTGETKSGQMSSLNHFNTSLPFGKVNVSEVQNQANYHYSLASFIFILSSLQYLILNF